MIPARRIEADAALDALRARLYRPGATAEDLRRYEDALAATTPAGSEVAEAEADAPAVRHRRRARTAALLLGAAVAAGSLAAVSVGLAAGAPTAHRAASSASPSTAPPSQNDLRWHPERPVTGVRLASDPGALQFHGRGAGTAKLDGRGLPSSEGRLAVLLTVADDAPVLWTATRVDVGPGSIVNVRVLAESSGRQRRAVPVPVSFLYAGGPPTEVHVQVPQDVAWGLVVAPRD